VLVCWKKGNYCYYYSLSGFAAIIFLNRDFLYRIWIKRCSVCCGILLRNNYSCVAVVRKRTIPTERPPLVGEVSANFFEERLLSNNNIIIREHAVVQWLRHYATNRKVAGSIPDEVNF
jgi:hypothetical protein